MRLARCLSATVLLLFFVHPASAQTEIPLNSSEVLVWAEYFGILAIGWGVGVTGWLVTGHQAMTCLFVDMPRAWKLWRNDVLTSSLPIYKYLLGGGFLLTLGTVLIHQLWGIWTQPFDVGLLAGVVVGAGHSFVTGRQEGSQIDFLEANQRFLNEKKVPLFTEYDGV